MIEILAAHLSDPRFGLVARAAKRFVESTQLIREHKSPSPPQHSKTVADLHAFRKRSGYYNEKAIIGLDETIDGLNSSEVLVHLHVAETTQGYVSLWLSEQNELLGLMVFKTIAEVPVLDR